MNEYKYYYTYKNIITFAIIISFAHLQTVNVTVSVMYICKGRRINKHLILCKTKYIFFYQRNINTLVSILSI